MCAATPVRFCLFINPEVSSMESQQPEQRQLVTAPTCKPDRHISTHDNEHGSTNDAQHPHQLVGVRLRSYRGQLMVMGWTAQEQKHT